MRIEILVGLENPVFYPINSSKTVIGSDLSCDIVVSEDQISRKHLIIVKEEENYFVIDQGSTNGSYLNEERLIPGRRVEFTSYFPVRLGSSVLVSLVSDEEALDEVNKISIPFPGETSAPKKDPRPTPVKPPRDADEQTRVVSLRDLQKSSTGSMVKRREAYKRKVADRAKAEADPKRKKKKGKKKKKKFLEFYEVVAIGILGLAIYFTYIGREEDSVPSSTQVSPEKVATTEDPPVEKKLPKSPSLLELFELKSLPKCSSLEEKTLCSSLKFKDHPWAGAVKNGDQIVAFVDGESYLQEAEKIVPFPKDKSDSDPEAIRDHRSDVMDVAVGLFLAQGFKNDDYLKLGDQELVFALLTSRNGIYLVELSFAIQPKLLQFSRQLMTPIRLTQLRQSGAEVMFFRKNIYDLVF